MNRKNTTELIFNIVLVVGLVAPRVVDLVKFTAADEPFWLVVGANYYYAVTHHEFEKTIYEYHPAVTTMWIVTGAMLIYFPEYRGLGQGYFDQEKTKFEEYLVGHGKTPLGLLWWGRLLQLLVNVSLLMLAFFLLRYMFDRWIALAVVVLASFSPYLFGQSRMLNHESMVGLFSLISVMAMTAYLFSERKPILLILSGGAAAFANLTKSSAIFLLPAIGVMIFVWALAQWREHKRIPLGAVLKIFFSWLGILLVVYFISWPGMWVAPGKMLYEVYGNAFSYAFQGARLSVTQELKPSSFSLNSASAGLFSFLVSIMWRTTPITWLGVFLAVMISFHKDRELIPLPARYLIGFLFLLAFACVSMFALARGRDQPHYLLTAYYAFEFASALGWMLVLRWLARSFVWLGKPWIQMGLFLGLLVIQAAGLSYTSPYYYTYLNPIMLSSKPVPEFFYGERMEAAAAYLAAKPDSENLTALVYFGRTFSYYFPGNTMAFKPVMFEDKALLIEYLQKADYLVMYTGLHERLPLLKELTPEKIIDLNGRQYVEIYRVADIPASFFNDVNSSRKCDR